MQTLVPSSGNGVFNKEQLQRKQARKQLNALSLNSAEWGGIWWCTTDEGLRIGCSAFITAAVTCYTSLLTNTDKIDSSDVI